MNTKRADSIHLQKDTKRILYDSIHLQKDAFHHVFFNYTCLHFRLLSDKLHLGGWFQSFAQPFPT